ncbi:MAG: hypothetical protein QW154_07160 [Sulfolobales archaeon]
MWKSEVLRYLCYPSHSRECVEKRLAELSSLGIVGVSRLIGKGHSSTVLEALLYNGARAALKVLRTDSKRAELLTECRLAERAYPLAPRVIECGEHYILMELVEGVSVAEAVPKAERIAALVLKVISAGRGLDIRWVEHRELSRADRHVLITVDGKVKIVDYESATMSERPGNVCRLTSWLLRRVLRIGLEVGGILELLRRYRKADEGERKSLFPELLKRIALVTDSMA